MILTGLRREISKDENGNDMMYDNDEKPERDDSSHK
jgi:hypothetical protein